MLVKNISSRLHHVGGVSIAPGQTVEIDDSFGGAINKKELQPVAVEAPVVEEVNEEAPVVEVKSAKEKNK